MSDLTLALNGEYFDAIKFGRKVQEFRLVTPYWTKRLEGRSYARVILTRGYPRADDRDRRLVLPWRGYERKTITHPHFGPEAVEVFAIDVFGPPIPAEHDASSSETRSVSDSAPATDEPNPLGSNQ